VMSDDDQVCGVASVEEGPEVGDDDEVAPAEVPAADE
jgi:hypothetical protein